MSASTGSVLHENDRRALISWLRTNALPDGQSTRAKILLALDEGFTAEEVAQRQQVGRATVFRWKARYLKEGIDSLADRARPGRPTVIDQKTVDYVLKLTRERVPATADSWSLASMAQYVGITIWQVRQIWKAAGIEPRRQKH